MLTRLSEEEWALVLMVFRSCLPRRGDNGRDDRKFLEALHYFTVHNITWRALPAEFGNWNSIWKRFWRLSRSGVFEAFFDALASLSGSGVLLKNMASGRITAPHNSHISMANNRILMAISLSQVRGAPEAQPLCSPGLL
jgi:transposase